MNKDIMRSMGFNKEVNLVSKGKCPFCYKQVDPGKFRNSESSREYQISGICQECQDDFFGK